MKISTYQTKHTAGSSTILQRIAEADKTAVKECLDEHGNLVWALAKKFTDSIEDAETATEEIFLDIWKRAALFDGAKTSEDKFIFFVACRCLIKRKSQLVSGADGLCIFKEKAGLRDE